MPRAEVGSTKWLSNQMKRKGLQRLRWYCQVCERQMPNDNAFKQHTMSESHVRAMLVVGENSGKAIREYSNQFKHDFLQLLRTSHGTKFCNANHFYQEYISNKTHVHQNSTQWHSLTEFVSYLGREGICRVQEGEKGLEVAWIDSSPEALRKQDALRRKERQDKGDEEREQMMIAEQVERAKRDALEKKGESKSDDEESRTLHKEDGQKIKLNFGANKDATTKIKAASPPQQNPAPCVLPDGEDFSSRAGDLSPQKQDTNSEPPEASTQDAKPKVSLSVSNSGNKPKNIFASASKKNALGSVKSQTKIQQQRPMSEAERIMKEELERKRKRESGGFAGGGNKKMKI